MLSRAAFSCLLVCGLALQISKTRGGADKYPPEILDCLQRGLCGDIPYEAMGEKDSAGAGEELIEGDIIVTTNQRRSRQSGPATWTGGVVPYVITSNSSGDRLRILQAIDHWEAATCLDFTEKPESYSSGPHLRFMKSKGCYSHIGMVDSNSGQVVSIGDGCTYRGMVEHEIGHAIGLWHQQSRRDRDASITVVMENIKEGREHNLEVKASADSMLGVPYDLGSLMHYSGFTFSRNGLPTIVTNDITLAGVIGNRKGLSHRDKQLVNLMYGCSASCINPPSCLNGGYVTASCECACPPGTDGKTCGTITGTYYGTPCGDQNVITAGTITSPKSSLEKHCVWIVTAPANKRVEVKFSKFTLYNRFWDRCHYDRVALHLDDDSIPELVKCGTELKKQSFTSVGRRLALELHTLSSAEGFTARISFI